MAQNGPANESAIKAPIKGVKLDVPSKFETMLEALTRGKFSCWVRYVIMFAWKPMVENLSNISVAAKT